MGEFICYQCELRRAFQVLDGMPITIRQLGKMSEFVIAKSEWETGDSLELVGQFIQLHNLDERQVLSWLDRNGIHSDTKFLFGVADYIVDFADEFMSGCLEDVILDEAEKNKATVDSNEGDAEPS